MPLFDESVDIQNVVSVTSSALFPVYVAASGGVLAVSQSNTPAGTQSVTASAASPVYVVGQVTSSITGTLNAVFSGTQTVTGTVYAVPSGTGSSRVFEATSVANVTRVPVNVTASTTLLAASGTRVGTIVFNESTGSLYVKFGATAAATSYTYRVASNQTLELEYGYNGRIDAILSSGSGNAQITELS
jgi:hypothetical protein